MNECGINTERLRKDLRNYGTKELQDAIAECEARAQRSNTAYHTGFWLRLSRHIRDIKDERDAQV